MPLLHDNWPLRIRFIFVFRYLFHPHITPCHPDRAGGGRSSRLFSSLRVLSCNCGHDLAVFPQALLLINVITLIPRPTSPQHASAHWPKSEVLVLQYNFHFRRFFNVMSILFHLLLFVCNLSVAPFLDARGLVNNSHHAFVNKFILKSL